MGPGQGQCSKWICWNLLESQSNAIVCHFASTLLPRGGDSSNRFLKLVTVCLMLLLQA
jgi:hypothetical protein